MADRFDGRQVDGTRVDDTRRYCTQNFDENALIFVLREARALGRKLP